MSEDVISNKIRNLYSRINRDLNKNISPRKCNNHVNDFDKLKDELYDNDYDWIEDFDDIDEVPEEGFFSDPADEEEINEVLNEVSDQLERMLYHMGINISNQTTTPKYGENIPSININFSPTMNQNVNSSSNANVNAEIQQKIDRLVKEFEKEYQKPFPDKSKLEKIVDKIGVIAPFASKLIVQLTEKINDLFF